ncbi:hypothetical protein CHELA40_13012 [Chelatococcus asaccharovorans]|nr:hypothetical protein CHELA40_13012 [Chelatococcus asaccharovorans]CAH1680853.1 hypothetical protein CHELA17_62607 [Chelatococcus asaccharovorans]
MASCSNLARPACMNRQTGSWLIRGWASFSWADMSRRADREQRRPMLVDLLPAAPNRLGERPLWCGATRSGGWSRSGP